MPWSAAATAILRPLEILQEIWFNLHVKKKAMGQYESAKATTRVVISSATTINPTIMTTSSAQNPDVQSTPKQKHSSHEYDRVFNHEKALC